MTNEKAIALVNDAFSGYYCDWGETFTKAEKDELAEANRMAIAALVGKDINVPSKEIIHCKDCKYARMTINGECKYCDIWFPDDKTYMPGDYFCGSAERKEEAE